MAAPRPSARLALLAVIATGVAIRLVLALTTDGSEFDMGSFAIVDGALRDDPLDVYGAVNQVNRAPGIEFVVYHWPYPPAYFPWILASTSIEARTPLPFHLLIELPAILADAALAWLAYACARVRGASEGARLAAAAVVALGPSFLVISGHHGQFDSLAILPAVVGVLAWERRTGRRDAAVAGALIGLGAAIKTTPLLMLLAILPTARSRGEGATAAAAALAVPAVLLLPFAVADPSGVRDLADYSGSPGLGGISMLVQPGLVDDWLTDVTRTLSAPSRELFEHGSLLTAAALLAVAALLARRRTEPRAAAVVLWLTLYAFGTGYFPQYLVWGLPFVVLAGWLREAAALQAAVLVPTLLFYLRPWESSAPTYVYVPIMVAVWAAMLVALVRLLRAPAAAR